MKKNKIALFGLAANPPTLGHRYVIESIINSKLVDEILIMPVYKHFHNKTMVSFENRFEMCNILFNDLKDKVKIVDFEKQIVENYEEYKGSTYELLNCLPNISQIDINNLYIVIGQDNAENILTWNNGNKLKIENKFIIIPREIDSDNDKWYMKLPNYFLNDIKLFNVSSTEVRNELKNNNTKRLLELVHKDVLSYILEKNLYTET